MSELTDTIREPDGSAEHAQMQGQLSCVVTAGCHTAIPAPLSWHPTPLQVRSPLLLQQMQAWLRGPLPSQQVCACQGCLPGPHGRLRSQWPPPAPSPWLQSPISPSWLSQDTPEAQALPTVPLLVLTERLSLACYPLPCLPSTVVSRDTGQATQRSPLPLRVLEVSSSSREVPSPGPLLILPPAPQHHGQSLQGFLWPGSVKP